MRVSGMILVAGVLQMASLAVWGAGAVPMKRYIDVANGVSFLYPAVWKSVKPDEYLQSFIQGTSGQPMVEVVFSPQGNLYEKTVLSGLAFLYFVVPETSEAACLKRGDLDGAATGAAQKVVIGGVAYTHVSVGDAATSHRLSSDVYATWRRGTCYLFEEDMRTMAPGVEEGKRDLTATEVRALQRHLDAVMQSVRLR
jgi:hypothetical protein